MSKLCEKCGHQYKGFGSTCSACRKLRPSGTQNQCSQCHSFFQGFATLCPECSHEDTDKCQVCQTTAYQTERLVVNSVIFHKWCFKCHHCESRLTATQFYRATDNQFYCRIHYDQLFKFAAMSRASTLRVPGAQLLSQEALEAQLNEAFSGVEPQVKGEGEKEQQNKQEEEQEAKPAEQEAKPVEECQDKAKPEEHQAEQQNKQEEEQKAKPAEQEAKPVEECQDEAKPEEHQAMFVEVEKGQKETKPPEAKCSEAKSAEPEAEHVGGGDPDSKGLDITLADVALIGARTRADSDANEGLWREVLHFLEIMGDNDAISSAGFDDNEDDILVYDDDEDDNHADTPLVGKSQSLASNGMSKRLSNALDQDGEVQLTELELRTLLSRLRDRELPDISTALVLVDQMRDHLHDKTKTVGRVPKPTGHGKLIIVGDIHGHLNDLLRIVDTHGDPCEQLMYLFNGDFVDRGIWGPEVLFTLYCLQLLHPKCVFLNRGNHETKFCTDRYGFKNDLKHAYPQDFEGLYDRIQESFDQLPLCHVVANSVFVAHGGLPAHTVSLMDLERLQRGPFPMQGRNAKVRTFQALLWSDPRERPGKSARGMGWHFSKNMTESFLADNGNMQCIVRSHECVGNGFDEKHDGLCKTVFSASNYDANNDATIVIVDSELKVTQGEVWNEPYMLRAEDGGGDSPEDARSAWTAKEELNCAAMDQLSKRVSDDRRWDVTPMERALDEVCQMIFLSRSQLLDRFVAADKTLDTPGQVTQEEWREIMALCLRTPNEFPWEEVGPYLFKPEANNNILYMDFLLRYDSPFSAWLGNQWCEAILDQVSNKTHAFNEVSVLEQGNDRTHAYNHVFNELDSSGTGALPYSSMRMLLQKVRSTTKAMDQTQAMNEAVRVYTLFRKLDRDRSGRVDRAEFLISLKEHNVEGLSNPYSIYVHLRQCQERLQVLQEQWDFVEQALRAVFKSRNDMAALFSLVDKKGTGRVHHRNFVKHMGRALRRDNTMMDELYANVCRWVLQERRKNGKAGAMKVEELRAAFAVRDRGEDHAIASQGTRRKPLS